MNKRFNKVLIANRGEIANRVLACLQKLEIDSVVIFHALDARSPVVANATESAEVYGDSPTAAYLDIEQIVSICKSHKVDAVHPGYGFLSENPGFVTALAKEGITFIGPGSDVMKLMGDKIASREFVESLGLPVPPSVTLDVDDPALTEQVAKLGYPVIVKASAGGGGKGMSIVSGQDELEATLRVAASEAEAYFGDSRVYVERYFEQTRHIEVQILGDGTNCVHLGERECSVQRRFQKIIEEAPSPALTPEKRTSICETAVAIARAAKYESAGTVEFLYTHEGDFYFLEMNTRIQVEHPVTEMIYGIDLIEQQINIAASNAMTLSQGDLNPTGHAIECRLYAEDAFNGYLPEVGKLLYMHVPDGVRFDSGLYQNQVIGSAFDPMLAKLIVHGESRDAAIGNMRQALGELAILGIKTNQEFLARVIDSQPFRQGDTHTGMLEQLNLSEPEISAEERASLLAASYLADRHTRQRIDRTPHPYLNIGDWRN